MPKKRKTFRQKMKEKLNRQWLGAVWRKFLIASIILTISGTLIIIVTSVIYLNGFLRISGLSVDTAWKKVNAAIETKKRFSDTRINFLILGLDRRNDEFEQTVLTDTIIWASLNTTNAQLTLIPISRDLWIAPLKTKVNALYYYGELKEGTTGSDFLINQLSQIAGQSIHYYLLMDYKSLPDLVDTLGGINVYVEKEFQDNFYPNPNYSNKKKSEEPLYISVKFTEGWQHLSGDKALQFIRSRSSNNQKEGNDLARSSRQAQLIKGLFKAVKNKNLIRNPEKIGKLYRFWKEKIKTNLKDEELLALALTALIKNLQISHVQLPASYKNESAAILIHPPVSKYGLWVWEPRIADWSELKLFIKNAL